eukprot:4341539-Amphidinium_carterae.1
MGLEPAGNLSTFDDKRATFEGVSEMRRSPTDIVVVVAGFGCNRCPTEYSRSADLAWPRTWLIMSHVSTRHIPTIVVISALAIRETRKGKVLN